MLFQVNSIGGKQSEIEDKYQRLMMLGETRKRKLEEACKGYQLLREANDLAEWIKSRVSWKNELTLILTQLINFRLTWQK